jgi:hypothetical protein
MWTRKYEPVFDIGNRSSGTWSGVSNPSCELATARTEGAKGTSAGLIAPNYSKRELSPVRASNTHYSQ